MLSKFFRVHSQRWALGLCFTALAACSAYSAKIVKHDTGHRDGGGTDGGGARAGDAGPDAGHGMIVGMAGMTGTGGMSGTSGVGGSSGIGGTGGVDARGCRPNPNQLDQVCPMICPEICNGIDDDCNLRIDDNGADKDCAAQHSTALCNVGKCLLTACLDGYRDCDGDPKNGCEITPNDPKNCGLCGHVCSVENGIAGCAQNACVSTGCDSGFIDCDSDPLTCETPSNTLADCSACGKECKLVPNASPSCATGSCGVETCDTGYGDCDGKAPNGCEVLLNTLNDCGGCGKACSFPGTQASCSNSAQLCTATSCNAGYDECDADPQDGCESLKTANNCGQCGKACSVDALKNVTSADCSTGSCAIVCAPHFGDCDGDAQTGCETSLDSITHCGACAACPALANAVTTCDAGVCTLKNCTDGYGDCSGGTADGCETPLDTNANCKGCGTVCTKLSCGGGICTAIDCSTMPGYADCNGDGASCETNVTTDLNNCGACGNKCQFDANVTMPNATLTCTAAGCGTSCAAGFGDCDSNYKNGCETPLTTLKDCGSCGQGCAIANAGATCGTGACRVATCNQDYADCDNDKKTCETQLNTPTHCGDCNTVCSLANAVVGCGGTPAARSCTVTGCSQTYY
ncbi:MAG TPA: hypothetical protein VF331_27860, partial [Polyangiales bacterium]